MLLKYFLFIFIFIPLHHVQFRNPKPQAPNSKFQAPNDLCLVQSNILFVIIFYDLKIFVDQKGKENRRKIIKKLRQAKVPKIQA